MRLEDLHPDYQEQARRQVEGPPEHTPVLQLSSKADDKAEKELQKLCENWLVQRGYQRLTADNAERHHNQAAQMRGWFGHLHTAKRNPLMPDLFIFDSSGTRCLLVELKVADRWQPGQKEMVNMGMWKVCRRCEDFLLLVKGWEGNLAT
jgi:hypothetical protein